MTYETLPLFQFQHYICNHSNVVEKLEPEGSLHYARLICLDCKNFIKWTPKPKESDVSIVRLLHSNGLEEWQRKFLKLIIYRKPNKAEKVVLDAIAAKVESAI